MCLESQTSCILVVCINIVYVAVLELCRNNYYIMDTILHNFQILLIKSCIAALH